MSLDRGFGGGASPYAYSAQIQKPNNSSLFDILSSMLGNAPEYPGGITPASLGIRTDRSTQSILNDSAARDAAQVKTQKDASKLAKKKARSGNKKTGLPKDYIDPRQQALLDQRKRSKQHLKNDLEAAKHYGGNANIPKPGKVVRGRQKAIRQQDENMTDYLQNYLAEKMATVGGTFDYETALRESEKAIKEAYQRDISAIRSSNKRARADSLANRKDVEALYNALSRSYEESAQTAIEQGQQLAEMMQEVASGAAANVQDIGSQIANEQATLAQGLGVEEATSAYMPQQALNTQQQVGDITEEGAEDANRQLGYAGNQQRWLMRGGQNAQLEGTNRQADLLRDLQDYLQGNQDKIGELRSMRGRELASNKSEIMNSVAEMQAQQDEALWKQMMDYSNLKLDIEDTQADNNLANRRLRFDIRRANRDARQWAAEQGLDEAKFDWNKKTDRWDRKLDARKLELDALKQASRGEPDQESWVPGYVQDSSQALAQMNPNARGIAQAILRSKPFQRGYWYDEPGEQKYKLNPTSAAVLAEQMAKQQGITNPKQLALIRLAAMVYAEGGV